MEQQQIRVSFSVGTKLLISVSSILLMVIVFLNISTILLFREDKRAYTYQTQGTEAILAGREFTNLAKRSIETLRTLLGSMDPSRAISDAQSKVIQSLLENQSEIVSISYGTIVPETSSFKFLGQVGKSEEIAKEKIKLEDYKITAEWWRTLLPGLLKNSFAFLNQSKIGQPPTLTVIFADLSMKKSQHGMPVVIALIPFKDFGKDLQSLRITIATRSGWVLYDSDTAALFANQNIADNPLFKAAAASTVDSGAMEYEYKDSHYLGSYLNPGYDLIALSKTDWRKAMKPTYALIEKCVLLGMMAVGAAVIFAILFSKTLTAPIGRLYQATKQVASGDFSLSLDEKGSDELAALSKSFNTMASMINGLIKESVQKVKLENEFAIASTVQKTLIPPSSFQNDWVEMLSEYRPADQCGGDWWGFFGVGNRVAIMIADATGHGLPCALMTASARSCCSVMHKLAQEDPSFTFSPSAMLSFANRVVYDASQGLIMMTFFIAVIDYEARTLTYSNAGHNSPWLFKKGDDGAYATSSLTVPGRRVGEIRENDDFKEATLSIEPQDVLFFYTDGLTEGKNLAGEQYGKMKARKIVTACLNESGPSGMSSMLTTLVRDVEKHNEGKSFDDDVTIVAIRIKDGMPSNG